MLKSKLKKSRQSKQKNLDLLEKLGALKKAGIITNKEFQEKKKKILSKI
ncbi:SHOCT domain-containing protein [Nitrosarchaeum koreense]|nr:SHOCT domain-containing protein [Nitrosarchaeum koreense]